jgi:hypothetical protein
MAASPQAIVDALDDAILLAATKGFPLSYSINGRSLTFQSLSAITQLRSTYAAMAADQTLGAKRSRARFQGGTQ